MSGRSSALRAGKVNADRTSIRAVLAGRAAILRPLVFELRDGPRDECGVFGISAPGSDVARLTYFALYALQHRGQESAGIAVSQGGHIMAMRDKGLVNQVFDEQKLRALHGDLARRARPVLDDGRELVGEHAARLARRPARGRARPQRQPRQRGRAPRRAPRPGRDVPLDVGLRDHRRAALDASRGADRGRGRRRHDAARGRVLDGGQHRRPRRRVPRSRRPAPALARHARRALLRRVRDAARSTSSAPASCATSSRARSSR